MRKSITALFIAATAVSFGFAGERVKPVSLGKTVPEFVVEDLSGKSKKLSDLQKPTGAEKRLPIVLSFWCATCESCRDVEGPLAKLAADFKGKAVVMALDANAGETVKDIAALLKEKKLSLTVLLDAKGKTADLFHTRVTTTTVVIDAKGVLRYHGRFNGRGHEFARDALKAVLAGKTVSVKKTRPHG